ncbi:unnamed protein product [Moneuplotes crassus]|uniref:Uncharacterized protein n=1 Tax=Euplotes crassus TaxID=5936 RepID=A0AAD1U204_EUPCR|nr:unnamed protein product [Moneuplotes crassus]
MKEMASSSCFDKRFEENECNFIEDEPSCKLNCTASKTFGADKRNPLICNKGKISSRTLQTFQKNLLSSLDSDDSESDSQQKVNIYIFKNKCNDKVSKFQTTKQESSNPWVIHDLGCQAMHSNNRIPRLRKNYKSSFTCKELDSPEIMKRILYKKPQDSSKLLNKSG